MKKLSGPSSNQIPTVEIYKQQYVHFGRMNDLLYKLPSIYSALIGALWYFAYTSMSSDRVISTAVFIFAGVVCWYSIVITGRFRSAFNIYIDRLNDFDREFAVTLRSKGETSAKKGGNLSTVRAVQRTLWCAFMLSVLGACYSGWPFIVNSFDWLLILRNRGG